MKEIIVQPINYDSNKIDEIVCNVEKAMYTSVKGVNKNKHFYRSKNLLERMFSIVDYLNGIRKHNQSVLAITDLKIVNPFTKTEPYGITFDDNLSIVSTHLLYENQEYFPEDAINIAESLSIISVHELGHANGLVHHKRKKTRNKKLCNMYVTSAISEVFIKNGKNILLRDTDYCDDCWKILEKTN